MGKSRRKRQRGRSLVLAIGELVDPLESAMGAAALCRALVVREDEDAWAGGSGVERCFPFSLCTMSVDYLHIHTFFGFVPKASTNVYHPWSPWGVIVWSQFTQLDHNY